MKVNAISVDDTRYFHILSEDKTYIKSIHTVYAYTPDQVTHLCELTPSYHLVYLYTYIDFQGEIREDKRGELDETYCYLGGEDTYMWCSEVEKLTERKECGDHDDMDTAREYLCGNCPF